MPSVNTWRDENLGFFPTEKLLVSTIERFETRAADNESALSGPSAEDLVPERIALRYPSLIMILVTRGLRLAIPYTTIESSVSLSIS
jgi:hypothetical protein